MRIQSFVEGFGEVQALPVLLRRFQGLSGAFTLNFERPIRASYFQLTRELPLRALIRRTLQQRSADGLLFLFDGDDACPKELAPRIQAWAQEEAGHPRCAVVIAQREYEAWFLASLTSLRGIRSIPPDAAPPLEPEAIRGAKERLGRGYDQADDQAALTAVFDLAAAYRSCRSFRRMVRAFGLLAEGTGIPLADWPPPSWLA